MMTLSDLPKRNIAYLEKFPVYDLEAYGFEASREKWEPAFGDLASWLLNAIETTFTNVSSPKVLALGIDAPELGRLQEVTFFLAAYAHITDKLFNKYIFYPDSDQIRPPPPLPGRVRKVSVAMLGTFCPEEVSMPETVEDSADCYLVNERLVLQKQRTPWAADIPCALGTLQAHADDPHLRNGFPSPPPEIRFIDFILAKFFKTRFKDDLFGEESPHHNLAQYQLGFLQNPGLISDRSIMLTTWLFAAKNKAPPSLG